MRLLRIQEVIQLTGLSRMSIYRFEKRGEFPKRRQVGRNSVRWVDDDIKAWMSSRPFAVTHPEFGVGLRDGTEAQSAP